MRNRRISFSLGKTINTGNFQSLRLDVGVEEDISETESIPERMIHLHEQVNLILQEALKKERDSK